MAYDKLSNAHEFMFKTMRIRALDRSENGRKTPPSAVHFILFLLVFLLIMISINSDEPFAMFGSNGDSSDSDDRSFIEMTWEQALVLLGYGLIFVIGLRLISYKYLFLYYLFFVYEPMITILIYFSVGPKGFEWVWFGINIARVIVIIAFIFALVIYPKLIRSDRHAAKFWHVQVVNPRTIAYKRWMRPWSDTYTCMYDGETDDDGYPDGYGRWFDESYDGEILSGQWANGVPIAPFISHSYGKGDGIIALRIVYFMASDDVFDKSSNPPSNENEPKIGVASVECSVSGTFYSHLPSAKEIFEPITFGSEGGSMSDALKQLTKFDTDNVENKRKVEMSVVGSQVLEVNGHVYNPPGNCTLHDMDQIIVDVKRNIKRPSPFPRKKPMFMPSGSSVRSLFGRGSSIRNRKSVMIFEQTIKEEMEEVNENEESAVSTFESREKERNVEFSNESEYTIKNKEEEGRRDSTRIERLEVRDWTRNQQKEALIFFGGWKVCSKFGLGHLGQFLALTSLNRRVYPILYSWPVGTWFSYPEASHLAASPKNKHNFYLMLRSLSFAGIRCVHLMSHSMGVQNLLAMFENKDDDDIHSRSDVSLMFQQDPAFNAGTELEGNDKQLMVCKNIILMNPDFNLEAFVDRAFLSIRRICQNITMMGDRNDFALRASKIMNLSLNRRGKEQSHLLQSNKMLKGFYKISEYLNLGRDINLLYIPEDKQLTDQERDLIDIENSEINNTINSALLFKNEVPMYFTDHDELRETMNKKWLDMDIIETTSLDSNMQGIRHSGFNMNPNILRDLTELISEGKRASKRSSLLLREGNMYTYSAAPSYVTM